MAERMENKSGNVSDPPRKRHYGRILLDAVAEIVLRLTTFAFGFAWWGLKWSIAVVIFLAIMAVAGFYVFNEAVANDAAARVGKASVVVPDVQGSHKDTARRKIDDAGLSYGELNPMPSVKFQKDYVMVQRPEPGSVVRAGRRVFVTLSTGQESISVPDVRGKKEPDARAAIEVAGLTVGPSVAHLPSTGIPGTVIGQDPVAGQMAPRSSSVSLLVSEGQTTVAKITVPDLVGMTIDDAKARLTQLGLVMQKVQDPDPNAQIGVVLKQVPENGREIPEGGSVAVNVRLNQEVPDMRQRKEFRYAVPQGFGEREVRIDTIDAFGERKVAFQQKLKPEYAVTVQLTYANMMTAEVYLDGVLKRRVIYQENSAPTVTDF